MSCWWDEDHELLLLTPEEFAALPDGTELTAIDGDKAIKGQDEIDDDTRGGHLMFGVTGNHPLRVAHLERMVALLPKPKFEVPLHRAWQCKIGIMVDVDLPPGSDALMRRAVERTFFELTGQHAEFNFSGWGASLDRYEYEAVAPTTSPRSDHE